MRGAPQTDEGEERKSPQPLVANQIQLGLAHWYTDKPPIIGATKVEHVVDNCDADRVRLGRAEWYSLLQTVAQIDQHA